MFEAYHQWSLTHPLDAFEVGTDAYFMRLALSEAEKGWFSARPNPMVGCLLVDSSTKVIVSQGHHAFYGQAHAEVNALNDLKKQTDSNLTAYVTLEPCSHTGKTPPCADALIQAGITRCVIALGDPNPKVAGQGIQRLKEAGIDVYCLESDDTADAQALVAGAKALNPTFLWGCINKRPYIALKTAQTLDAAIATRNGHSQWVTSEPARAWVHEMRGGFDGILSTAETVLKDHSQLTVRTPLWDYAQDGGIPPKRVIVDRHFRLADVESHPLFDTTLAETWLLVDEDVLAEAPKQADYKRLSDLGVDVKPMPFKGKALAPLLEWLFTLGIRALWVEAGGRLTASLHQQGLVNDYNVLIAPKLLGDPHQHIPAWHLHTEDPPSSMGEASVLHLASVRPLGQDVLLAFTIK
ncbi:MAG: bifunctional diaminohydroxyphosphoribosylaminopyrimidine deaminase/5-amino-6-(5-phosphoribosylamino)uracil reductase RibD [Vampirovibrionales bacterium]|jgi:diaminohydroxyphosphoribosylaminopyrimidine deaminase/5-amino-6-(5-phosphoribosylamino)uracil reductase|nr:bifunctional diaminohydroxyphosphoribosylaminopyrimidine deaminase/5-amino-6-(5-phosphoribosylamino)uracil reductase RibD [Vampirovibrionales bacterium]